MINKNDLICGSVIAADDDKLPAIIKGANKDETIFNVQVIINLNGQRKLEKMKISEDNLQKCNPVFFDVPTPFVMFENYDYISNELKKAGYVLTKNSDNSRTISWTDGGNKEDSKFNEVHLLQKFIYNKLNELLIVNLSI